MVDLCAMEKLETCTPVQRKAALVFWYQAEVNNGGHFQYFVNKASYPHKEVVDALRELGAHHSADVLAAALKELDGRLPHFPETAEDYEEERQDFSLEQFDSRWGTKGDKEVQEALLRYLRANEREFVAWVP
jgi:hypothetical protein